MPVIKQRLLRYLSKSVTRRRRALRRQQVPVRLLIRWRIAEPISLWRTVPRARLTSGTLAFRRMREAAHWVVPRSSHTIPMDAVVSETSVPLSPLVQSGRMYVEMNGPVSTGVAFANPNKQDAVISFYFTDIHNNALGYREGTFILGANCQMSGFLNQAPFNLPDNAEGTFTFTSSIGVSMVALRGFTNERNVFLMSTLPVPTLDTTNASPLAVLPHFAAGGGWTTKLVLVNPTDAVLSGNAQFFSPAIGYSAVSPLTLTVNDVPMSGFNYSIPARGVFAVTLNSADGNLASGSIRISASNGSIAPSGLAIFSLMNNGVTVSEASVPISPPAFALRVYARVPRCAGRGGIVQDWDCTGKSDIVFRRGDL